MLNMLYSEDLSVLVDTGASKTRKLSGFGGSDNTYNTTLATELRRWKCVNGNAPIPLQWQYPQSCTKVGNDMLQPS